MKSFKCDTLQEAWETINEFLFLKEKIILKKHGGRYGPEIVCYNVFMRVKKLWVDPNFDFARNFGYKNQKWTSLLNNYLDKNYLDLIRNEVQMREKKNSLSYSYSMHFRNIHTSGKDCLISLTIARRVNEKYPVMVFHVRASEVTKRLLYDFLLIQRIGEYIYGKKNRVSLEFYAPSCYITAENFSMYHNHKKIPKLIKGVKKLGTFQKRVLKILKDFMSVEDPNTISYKVNLRAVIQLQKNIKGDPISGIAGLYAKDLHIYPEEEFDYPNDCITEKLRRAFRKAKKNKLEASKTIKKQKKE